MASQRIGNTSAAIEARRLVWYRSVRPCRVIMSRRFWWGGDFVGTYRFNVIDDQGTVSFLGPRHGSKMVAAACGANHRSLDSMLTYLEALDEVWASAISRG